MKKIKVFIVDDSALVRQALSDILSMDSEIEVIGAAPDPIFAMNKMKKDFPDVIILDIEMPRMDGLTFLKKIMLENPTPVIICSTLTGKGAKITLDALAFGALDIINKPRIGLKDFFDETKEMLINSVKSAGRTNIQQVKKVSEQHLKNRKIAPKEKTGNRPTGEFQPKLTADVILSIDSYNIEKTTDKVVAIGTSAGGTVALEVVLKSLPRVSPGMVIVQHMPEKFTTAFAERLNQVCRIRVKEAENGDRVIPGLALIAPGNKHLLLKRSGAQYYAEVLEGPLVSRHRPSVDVLFRSTAKCAGKNSLGIIMTGMGEDGATGILEMFNSGAKTIAQSEKTCVVFGMPNEAIKLGGIKKVVDLEKIGENILQYYQKNR